MAATECQGDESFLPWVIVQLIIYDSACIVCNESAGHRRTVPQGSGTWGSGQQRPWWCTTEPLAPRSSPSLLSPAPSFSVSGVSKHGQWRGSYFREVRTCRSLFTQFLGGGHLRCLLPLCLHCASYKITQHEDSWRGIAQLAHWEWWPSIQGALGLVPSTTQTGCGHTLQQQSHPWLHSTFETSLGYIGILSQKTKKQITVGH